MVFEGELVAILNGPINDEECRGFAQSVFHFPAATLVFCAVPPTLAPTIEQLSKKASEIGRSMLVVPDFQNMVNLFQPDKVFYFDHRIRRHLDVSKLVELLKTDKTAALVFGSPPHQPERIGINIELDLPAAVSIILYTIDEGINPMGLMPV